MRPYLYLSSVFTLKFKTNEFGEEGTIASLHPRIMQPSWMELCSGWGLHPGIQMILGPCRIIFLLDQDFVLLIFGTPRFRQMYKTVKMLQCTGRNAK